MKGMALLGGQDPGSRGNGLAVPHSPHLKLQESHREVRFQGEVQSPVCTGGASPIF